MKEHPATFKPHEVRATLAGTQTQFRRIVEPQPDSDGEWCHPRTGCVAAESFDEMLKHCPYGQNGDRLWVKEAIENGDACARYSADGEVVPATSWPWKRDKLPGMFCPRGLSRITLEVTDVRVQRLQEISNADADAEGVCDWWLSLDVREREAVEKITNGKAEDWRGNFHQLWESINGPGSWDANPWVWAIAFRRVTP